MVNYFKLRKDAFELFYRRMKKQNVNVLVVELLFNNQESEVCCIDSDIHIKVQCTNKHICWQKNRLITFYGIPNLPDTCKYVVITEADIVFLQSWWTDNVKKELDKHIIIQPYNLVNYTKNNNVLNFAHSMESMFSYMLRTNSADISIAATGMAWAMKREFFNNIELFDKCILGGNDVFFTLGCGNQLNKILDIDNNFRKLTISDYSEQIVSMGREWADNVTNYVKNNGGIGYTSDCIIHLWHGKPRLRRYDERGTVLKNTNFDIEKDVFINEDGLYEWKDTSSESYKAVVDFLQSRKEDN